MPTLPTATTASFNPNSTAVNNNNNNLAAIDSTHPSSRPSPSSYHHHHNSHHFHDDVDHNRDAIRKDDMSSEDASRHFHHPYKPRASSSGMSGISPPVPSSANSRKQALLSSIPPTVAAPAPPKRRRGDHRDPPADSDAPTAGHVDVSDSPPRIPSSHHHPHHDHSNRNGKHLASKSRPSSTSAPPPVHTPPKSTTHALSPPLSSSHPNTHPLSHPPPPTIDLNHGSDAPHLPSTKESGDRSRVRQGSNARSGGGNVSALLPVQSPQGSPNLSGARGSGRVRTPSVLLSSHPGEKSSGGPPGSKNLPRNPQITYCLRLVKDMMRVKDGQPFGKPIDQLWTVDQVPGYFDIIKQPMDLGTVKSRIEANGYMKTRGKKEVEEVVFDVEAYKSDVKLVFENARTYNRPGDMFYEAATRLLEKFEVKMKRVPSATETTSPASKKLNKKRKKSSSSAPTGSGMGGGVGSSNAGRGMGTASDPIVLHDSITTATGGGGRKNESSKKRKVSKGEPDENGRANRTSKKKPPIPSGAGGVGGKSRVSAGGGSSSKKKKVPSGGASGARGGVAGSSGGRVMVNSSKAEPEVMEVKPHHVKPEMTVADMEVRLLSLRRQRSLLESGAPMSPPAGSSTSYKAQAQALYHVEMTFQEKVQLSNNVGKLPADKLRRIVALATKNKTSSMELTHNEEIELDIDSMNNETLREMEAYVNQILSKGKKKGSGSSALTTSPNADLLSMNMDQVDSEIEKLSSILRKKNREMGVEGGGGKDNGDDGDGKKRKKSINSNKSNNSNLNKQKSHNSNTHNKTKHDMDAAHPDDKKKKKSFYDSESSSDSDDSGDDSGSGSSDDDSSSDESDSSDEEDDSDRDGDEDSQRKRRERNLAHQQAMQQAGGGPAPGGTPLPSPGYQSSQRSC